MSKIILWCIAIVLCGIGVLLTWKKGHNKLNLFVNIVLPFEIYTIIIYHKNIPTFMNIVIVASIILSLLYFSTGMIITVNDSSSALKLPKIKHIILGTRALFAFGLFVILIYFFFNIFVFHSLFPRTVNPEETAYDSNKYFSKNIETIYGFTKESWDKLSTKEKLNSLQILANIEQNRLGINHELTVILNPAKETTIAFYNPSTQEISVSIKYLNKDYPSEMVLSICHEARHAWQHQLCEIYDELGSKYDDMDIMRQAKQFKKEFANYQKGDSDYEKYSYQLCEIDANDYAKEEASFIYNVIHNKVNNSKADS